MVDTVDDQGIPAPEGNSDIIETDYEIGQDNFETKIGPFGLDFHNPVFAMAGISIVAFVFFALALPDQANAMFSWSFDFVTKTFDWFFLSAANIFVIFCLFLIVSPYGSIRLGGTEATPDYSYIGWFAMLFAAGMGIGLMFFGVSEPMSHFGSSLGGTSVENGLRTDWAPLGAAASEAEATRLGMAATIFHWGLHPWAIYAVVALALALFSYNKGLPLTLRSAFYPIFGERVWGWTGHIIDTLAVFATLFGLATSLGFGAEQAASGLTFLYGSGDAAEGTRSFLGIAYGNSEESGVADSSTLLVLLITGITAIALISVARGLDGGVKVLSEINMGLAGLLLLFTLIVGGPIFLLTFFADSLWAYLQNLIPLSNPFGRDDTNFVQGWTAFYWAWWISWSPFVGMFIARVSRGRSVREFLICVLLIPSLVCVLWMSVFGGTAISQVVNDGYTAAKEASLELKLFYMLDQLPLATITSTIGIILVVVFFVTSSDSGSLVIDTITAGGKVDAPVTQRVFWCIFEGAVAIVLLIGGGLAALQSAVISTGLPFTMVLLVMCWAIFRGLQSEKRA
ncbi:BCCT family transporter [Roseovarius nanhaiticus]|uniref:Betaine/carnitine transporter, BCCT family n=1 Tax=Roseovarius nanhaiticus TaxID=573024 RepID=A0A1N7GV82_9RHOB|nr:BCCT family transporter [Roseovarius nanhaiticus]SEL31587.1 betaine/carnitine transporter, BCCT family [Roseovarius nanhaiticus]SIS16511.1 betaine/carnitine transporter, BCCT family [Roseovarius nanhaiticus]